MCLKVVRRGTRCGSTRSGRNGAYDTLRRCQFAPTHCMSLNLEEVARIAKLARIELSATEADSTREQLNNVLGFIAQLQSIDTKGIEPMAHAVDVVQRLRPDIVSETDRRDAFQSIAPETEAGLYLVPQVIE